MRPVLAALALLAATGACAASRGPDPAACAALFARYDSAVRNFGTPGFDEDFGVTPPAAISRLLTPLRMNGCLTSSEDLDGLEALAQRLAPFAIVDSGPAIRPTPVHLGILTSAFDEPRVTRFFRGLGYRSRGVGAEGLGRRIYIGPFSTHGALDQALALAREAGFIAPYAATHTRF
jgi:hypothetical protein